MLATQFVSRVSLPRDQVDAFDRHPFSLPVLRDFDAIDFDFATRRSLRRCASTCGSRRVSVDRATASSSGPGAS